MYLFSIFFNMKVFCVFSLESPHRGDSHEYIQYTTFNVGNKITLNYQKSAAMSFMFQGTQERVQNSRGKRAIGVRATEVLLYIGDFFISLARKRFVKISKNKSCK